jgi:hypothetical protein
MPRMAMKGAKVWRRVEVLEEVREMRWSSEAVTIVTRRRTELRTAVLSTHVELGNWWIMCR